MSIAEIKSQVSRDVRLILIAKSIRTFCYGFLGVLFPIYLTDLGLGPRGLGTAVSLTLLFSAALTFAIRRPSERYGPRAVLIGLTILIILSAALFLVFHRIWMVVIAAMIGNLAVGTGETGPFLSLEQVSVARMVSKKALNGIMSFYNLTGYIAAALGAGLVGKALLSATSLFLVFLVGGLIQLIVYFLMTSKSVSLVESPRGKKPSQSLVRRLAVLFGLDSFAGGFILQSLVLYWFHSHFGLGLGTLGWISFGTQILSGLSFLLATPLARYLGLVNTMVFSHLISNALLISIAFAPTAVLAISLLFARHLLSQIDVPTRQTFLMLVVEDQEREGAVTLTNMSRTLTQSASPTVSGWVMQIFSLSAPFVLAGGLKMVYDLLLYATVRKVKEVSP